MKHHPQRFILAFVLCVLAGTNGHLSIAYAQVLSPGDSLVLVDANETIVGQVFGLGTTFRGAEAYVAFQVDPFLVILGARVYRLEGSFRALWEAPDCRGSPVIDARLDLSIPLDTQIFTPVAVASAFTPGKPLGKVYVADPNDTPSIVTIRSFERMPAGCNGGENREYLVVNTVEILDLDSLFTPSFHVEVVSETPKGGGPKKK